jgi:unsaturated rhamnogalacturonyl hydrolase
MKVFVLLCYLISFGKDLNSQSIYDKSSIKSIMNKVIAYQNRNPWTDEADYDWIRGTYYTGIMACYQATADKKFLDQCIEWGEDYKWNVPTGKPVDNPFYIAGANLLTCTQTWLECYLDKKRKDRIAPTIAHLEKSDIKNPVTSPTQWYYGQGVKYVDALYVAGPALAMLYKITGNEKYAAWLDSFFWDVYGTLYDEKSNLFYRDIHYMPGYTPGTMSDQNSRKTFFYQKTANGKKVIWSRGNGWAFAALARILKYLPKDYGNWEKYKTVFIKMAQSLKDRQDEDGYWHPNLDDPMDFPYKETSGTGFFTYGMAWGINNGILDKTAYLPAVKKGWEALHNSVSTEGKVQWGQLEAGSPFIVKREDSHEYVSGAFLLAASEVYRVVF